MKVQVFGPNVRFGVQSPPNGLSFSQLLSNWKKCEQLGYEVAYVTDHFISVVPDHGAAVFEGPTVLSALASQTTQMRCGLMVAGNTFRNPGQLAKIAVTLDHVSDGRFELGMGAGHRQIEHEQYGITYPTQGTRIRMLGESAQAVRSLLSKERTNFDGRYYRFADAICEPKPRQELLPILIGGIGEELSLRVVAESADIWNNWTSPDLATYEQKVRALENHCRVLGRDPGEIRRSMHIKPLVGESKAEICERVPQQPRARWRGTPEQLIDHLLPFIRLGVGDFIFMLDEPADLRSLELVATRVAPRLREEGRQILSAQVATSS